MPSIFIVNTINRSGEGIVTFQMACHFITKRIANSSMGGTIECCECVRKPFGELLQHSHVCGCSSHSESS